MRPDLPVLSCLVELRLGTHAQLYLICITGAGSALAHDRVSDRTERSWSICERIAFSSHQVLITFITVFDTSSVKA